MDLLSFGCLLWMRGGRNGKGEDSASTDDRGFWGLFHNNTLLLHIRSGTTADICASAYRKFGMHTTNRLAAHAAFASCRFFSYGLEKNFRPDVYLEFEKRTLEVCLLLRRDVSLPTHGLKCVQHTASTKIIHIAHATPSS